MKQGAATTRKRQYVPLTPPAATGHRRAVLSRVAPLLLPLLLVNATAIWGQAGWAYDHVAEPTWTTPARVVIAILFATTIEAIGIFLAWEAHLAMMADQASGALRAGSYAIGAAAGWINWSHWYHNGEDVTRAATFAGLSAISPWLWAIWSRARNRTRLAELDMADARGLKLSTSRKVWHPVKSLKLTRWAAWSGETRPATAVAAWEATQVGTQPVVEPAAAPATTPVPPSPPQPSPAVTAGRTPSSLPAPAPATPTPDRISGSEKVDPDDVVNPNITYLGGRTRQRERIRRATEDYLLSLQAGAPLSARELAGRYPPMSESWGRKVIRNSSQNGHAPVERITP